ncbi:leucine Rich Repeat domain protein [Clostridium botulinum C str. Eklund]|nr:leucine Rich Repeat domain protein [Clostridium botulinum C str. Eklund]NEZ48199.1 hypothetical protein [Clostridium botulinum]
MDIFEKINKGVGVAATAIIIAGGTPQVVQAMTNPGNAPRVEAKQLCKNIEKSIKDGTYKVNPCLNMNTSSENKSELIAKVKIKTLKAENDEPSMSGTYLEKEARYVKENGKIYCEINVLALDWMQKIWIEVDGKKVQHTQKETGATEVMGMAHKGGVIRFEVPKVNPKLTFHMYVVPMSSNVIFRVVGEKVTTVSKPEKPVVKPNTKPTKPVQDGDSQNRPNKPQEKPVIEPKPQAKPTEDKKEAKETIVKVKALKAENNEPSMSGTYLGKEAKYTEENGKTYCEVNLLALDWMQNIKIEADRKEVEHTQKETGATEVMGMAHKAGVIRFEVPKINSKLVFHMYVVPMKCDVTFRVVEDKAVTPEKESQTKPENPKPQEKPVQDGDSQNKPSKPQEKPTKPNNSEKEKPVIKPEPKPNEDKKEAKETIVKVKALKAENNEPSMSGTYLGKEAKYTEENGKTYCEVNLLALDWIQKIWIEVDGKKVQHTQKETGATEVMGMAHKGGVVRFEVPRINSKLVFHMYVVPMKSDVTFRVVEDKAVTPEKPTKPDTKPSNTGKDKPIIYEIASKIQVKAEDKKIINKYIDLDELQKKIDTKVENGKKYVTLKIKGKTDDITIRVNGDVVHKEIIGEKLDKLNRLASGSTSGKVNKPEEITLIRFEVPNTESKKSPRIEIKIHDKELKRDVNVAFNLDTKKEQTDSQKPSEKPAEKPTTKPSTKPNGDTSKPAKPENRPEAKKEVTKNIKVKALKEKSNEPSMAGEYLDKNVIYTEKNGKRYFTLTVNRIDWMKNISISVNGRNVRYDKKESGNTAELTFEVNNENSEVMLHMNVVPMGSARVAFRVVKDGSTGSSTKPTTNPKADKENKVDNKKEKDKLKINANEEGMYKVNIDTLKKDCDEKSMAGQYLNSTANYEVNNGTKYIILTLNRMDWMKNVTVYVNGDKKKYEEKSIGKNRSEIKFETDDIGAEIKLEMNVVPMGNARVTFRVVPKKSSLELTKKYYDNTSKTDEKVDSKKDNKDDNKTDTNKDDQKDNVTKPNSNKEDYNKDTTHKPADTAKSSEKVTKESNKDKDGLYEVNIKALKEKNNEPSMAGTYLGDKIKVQIKNGKKYATVTFNRSDWMKNIDVLVNDKSQKYDVVNVKTNNAGEKISTIKFEIPSLESEVKFKMNVEPMGNARVTFRMLMQKDSFKFLEGNEYDPNKAEEYLNNLAIGSKENKNSKSSSYNSSDNNNHNQSTIAEKKLPKTGLPFGGGVVASIGGILSGLGITLMKKNKKKGE